VVEAGPVSLPLLGIAGLALVVVIVAIVLVVRSRGRSEW
jgi:hypothetical protein